MKVSMMEKIMSMNSFTAEQRLTVLKYLRKKYYAQEIDMCIYTNVRNHVDLYVSRETKEGK